MKLAKIQNNIKILGVGNCGLVGNQHSPECLGFHWLRDSLWEWGNQTYYVSRLHQYSNVSGKGTPSLLCHNSCAPQVSEEWFPSSQALAEEYRHQGGLLTDPAPFGPYIYARQEDEAAAWANFGAVYPSLDLILDATVNGHGHVLRDALLHFIDCSSHNAHV